MAEKYNICLDIGGTKVLGAVFDSKDNIVYRYKKKSAENGASSQNVEEVIVSVVDELLKSSGIKKSQLNAISAGAPGVISRDTFRTDSPTSSRIAIATYLGRDSCKGFLQSRMK